MHGEKNQPVISVLRSSARPQADGKPKNLKRASPYTYLESLPISTWNTVTIFDIDIGSAEDKP